MAYIADLKTVKTYLKSYCGESKQCVSAVKLLAGAPQTKSWRRGLLIKGNKIDEGTAIATFESYNKYKGHAAIYISQDEKGIYVYDQWDGQPLNKRLIQFKGYGYVSNDGDKFYVID